MIYLAAPYSHSDPVTVEFRMKAFLKADAELTKQGKQTVSPLYKHFMGIQDQQIGMDWRYWQNYSIELIRMCSELIVLTLPGWRTSAGVQAEIELAHQFGLPISYLDVRIDQTILSAAKVSV
jgi:hypothetical protein